MYPRVSTFRSDKLRLAGAEEDLTAVSFSLSPLDSFSTEGRGLSESVGEVV